MQTFRSAKFLSCLSLVAWLAACASGPPPPVISAEEIAAAEAAGSLEELWGRMGADVEAATAAGKPAEALKAAQAEIGERIGALQADQIRLALAETPRIEGLLPANAIEAQQARAQTLGQWSTTAQAALHGELSAEMMKTRQALADRQAQLDELAPQAVPEKMELLAQMGTLAGSGSPAQIEYSQAREDLLSELNRDAAKAIEAEAYESAREMLAISRQADPANEQIVNQLVEVDTKVFEKKFWQALEQGQADKGYSLLEEISSSDTFDGVRLKLASSKDVMADYYVSLGATATQAGRASEAYRRFNEARNIRTMLGEDTIKPPAEEAPFILLLEKEFQAAKSRDEMGLAWGYLNVIKSIQPETSNLRRNLRETRDVVLQRAIKRLTTSPFEDPGDSKTEFGDEVASKVVQHLFRAIPNDVRIIEREQLSDILREKKLSSGSSSGLAAADYLVQGTILEAKVDSVEKRGKKTMRVTTDQVQVPNPQYNEWVNLSAKERKNRPQPAKTILGPKKEDVTIEVTVHRKVGIFSVSFRLIEAATAKVVFADSVRKKAQHEDSSSEGVELGEFKLEFKLASLPSDIEILADLADQVSSEIGAALVEVLTAPEVGYQQAADRFVSEGNFEAAAEQYAYAVVLSERKELDTDLLQGMLLTSSVASADR